MLQCFSTKVFSYK